MPYLHSLGGNLNTVMLLVKQMNVFIKRLKDSTCTVDMPPIIHIYIHTHTHTHTHIPKPPFRCGAALCCILACCRRQGINNKMSKSSVKFSKFFL